MDAFRLKLFFNELLKLSYNDIKPGWGNPCSHLLDDMCMRQEPFLDRIMNDYTGDSHEYRLDNAGVKLYWHMRKDDRYARTSAMSERRFRCRIGGDLLREYPMFGAQVRSLILQYNFNMEPRFKNLK